MDHLGFEFATEFHPQLDSSHWTSEELILFQAEMLKGSTCNRLLIADDVDPLFFFDYMNLSVKFIMSIKHSNNHEYIDVLHIVT